MTVCVLSPRLLDAFVMGGVGLVVNWFSSKLFGLIAFLLMRVGVRPLMLWVGAGLVSKGSLSLTGRRLCYRNFTFFVDFDWRVVYGCYGSW